MGKLIILICLVLAGDNLAFAEPKNCSLNAEWFGAGSGIYMIKLKQTGSKITLDGEMIHPFCGAILVDGDTDGHYFSFRYGMSKTDDGCEPWAQITGEFISSDCAIIQGEMALHKVADVFTVPFKWYKNIIKIISPIPSDTLIISAQPKMPPFNAIAALTKPDGLNYLSRVTAINFNAPPYAWNVRMKHSPIPGRLDFDAILDEVVTNDPTFTPNFNLLKTADKGELIDSGIMGGELTLSIDYYKSMRDEKKYIIKGTNPGQRAIEQVLTDPISQHIACQESRYKQFEADREGGIGFPNIGKNSQHQPVGGAGIMQLYLPKPSAAQVWNWRENLKAGLKIFNDKLTGSKRAHIRETVELNNERQANGLPPCPNNAITPLNEEQLLRETIRRYNCGREYRWEPRDAPHCEGTWVFDLSCKREEKKGYDPNYVNKVLNCNIDV